MSKPKACRSHDDATAAMFRRDPGFSADYLSHILHEGDQTDLMLALRQVINACGGIAELAQRTSLNPTTLYRTLSSKGNPELKTLTTVLNAIGMHLAVVPNKKRRKAA